MRRAGKIKVSICSLIIALLGVGPMNGNALGEDEVRPTSPSWSDVSPHQSAFVEGDKVRLNYLDWGGNGPPLILIHGIANSPHIFDDLVLMLRDRFHVIAYARRGHGQSDAPAGPYDSTALISDLVHLLDHLHIERASLLGWSMGGNEVTEFAGRYPERVNKIIYLEGGYDWSDPAFFKAFTDILAVNSPSPETLGTWRRDYTKVRAPVLAIYGTAFFPVDRSDSELSRKLRAFEQNAAAPFRRASMDRIRRELRDVRIVELDGRTHMSIGVIAPDMLATSIADFLLAKPADPR
jgi:pimeloyl-ACP methyl ester carboxylesterase